MKAKITVELYIDDYTDDDPATEIEKLYMLRESLCALGITPPPGVPYPKFVTSKAELVEINQG